jgi:hypothetical protein
MVVPKNVQSTVNHESQDLLPDWNALPLGIVASDLRTNVDVSDHGTTVSRSPQSERDHVSRTAVPEVAAIQARYRGAPDEGD